MSFHAAAGASNAPVGTPKLSRAVDEQGTQALAAAENRVALRRVQPLRTHVGRGQNAVENGLHA